MTDTAKLATAVRDLRSAAATLDAMTGSIPACSELRKQFPAFDVPFERIGMELTFYADWLEMEANRER